MGTDIHFFAEKRERQRWKRILPPDGYVAPDLSGPGITTEHASEVISRLKRGDVIVQSKSASPHVQDEWSVPLMRSVQGFVEVVIPGLEQMGPPDDVRIVFGFDS